MALKNACSYWISTHAASSGMAILFVCMAVVFCKTLFLHCEVNIISCTFHTEQHPPYGVHTVLSGMRKLILAVPTVKFTLVQIS